MLLWRGVSVSLSGMNSGPPPPLLVHGQGSGGIITSSAVVMAKMMTAFQGYSTSMGLCLIAAEVAAVRERGGGGWWWWWWAAAPGWWAAGNGRYLCLPGSSIVKRNKWKFQNRRVIAPEPAASSSVGAVQEEP